MTKVQLSLDNGIKIPSTFSAEGMAMVEI